MNELKSCPFCGEAELLEVDKNKYGWFISCYKCPCQGVLANTKEEAIKAWNTRTPMDKALIDRNLACAEAWINTTDMDKPITEEEMRIYLIILNAGINNEEENSDLILECSDILAIHILRNWSREKIENFAKHLLGNDYLSALICNALEAQREACADAYTAWSELFVQDKGRAESFILNARIDDE